MFNIRIHFGEIKWNPNIQHLDFLLKKKIKENKDKSKYFPNIYKLFPSNLKSLMCFVINNILPISNILPNFFLKKFIDAKNFTPS